MTRASPLTEGEAAQLLAPLADAALVLLAVSGGADSLALLVVAARWAASSGPRLAVATVDHGLRESSAAEAAHVAAVAAGFALPHVTLRWEGAKPRRGMEAAARTARYGLLEAHARAIGASHLVTAHTRDDQAETVLLRLAAGSGPAGLAAMRPLVRRGGLIHARPLLAIPKAQLVATLRQAGIGWCEDDTNRDPALARGRLRAAHAALVREGLTDARLARLAARSARAEDALAAAEAAAWREVVLSSSSFVEIDLPRLLLQPAELRLRVIGRAIAALGQGEVRLARLEALVGALEEAAARGGGAVRTLAGARVAIEGEHLMVVAAPPRRESAAPHPRRARVTYAEARLGNH
ncbi:MAG TPA: tRNA lysidine(34) synthetase TilS [Thermomicrobiales bacterium]|nr:tRNA lysidine(34) synthetase TilS [Thermomicrobiales bacterium]